MLQRQFSLCDMSLLVKSFVSGMEFCPLNSCMKFNWFLSVRPGKKMLFSSQLSLPRSMFSFSFLPFKLLSGEFFSHSPGEAQVTHFDRSLPNENILSGRLLPNFSSFWMIVVLLASLLKTKLSFLHYCNPFFFSSKHT